MGLVSRLADTGDARRTAIELATEIATFPWPTLIADRDSLYDGLGTPMEEGLALEAKRGATVLDVGAAGAARFSAGTGRHGK